MKKETPLLITLVIGIVGWCVTHVADRILGAPTLEISQHDQGSATENLIPQSPDGDAVSRRETKVPALVVVTATNISRSTRFAATTIDLRPAGKVKVLGVSLAAKALAVVGSQTERCWQDHATVTVPELHPGGSVEIKVGLDGAAELRPYVMCGEAIVVREEGVATCLARHELGLLVALSVLGSLAVLAYLWRG